MIIAIFTVSVAYLLVAISFGGKRDEQGVKAWKCYVGAMLWPIVFLMLFGEDLAERMHEQER